MMSDGKVDGLSLDDEHSVIKLISMDEKVFFIEKKFAFASILVKTSMDLGHNSEPHNTTDSHVIRADSSPFPHTRRPYRYRCADTRSVWRDLGQDYRVSGAPQGHRALAP